ncbi:zinc-binding alcohol dehydrogenase family protein [Aspergillus fijiensis CBS 313.89]|uniref:Putative ToxD-like zinc binding oxidoreductase n=1 Tax=Aspergillus fijiensis CBS 313.89 TaxID=1448319 RepID=A0A8G1RJU8_9EURO|nr:putative ToxD-like zinc binding oxidoreductase [Aspergillus fijiensis CBS 313.89]RAK75337.1 putative ToxD-like zinc binding oxidoreductase [Aspergillus fijiensis CBS 313.89]
MKAIITHRFLPKRLLSLALRSPLGQGAQVKDVPIPSITDDEVLVKVRAVALNPIDFKDIDFISPRNSAIGCDYAGEVARVGKNSGQCWKVGDRIAGFVHGGLYPEVGSFAEYLKVDGDLAWKVPDETTLSEATTYGVPAATAMLGLSYLGIDRVDIENGRSVQQGDQPTILIYSGGSNVGLFAIQLAKRAGYTVVVTASPRSFDLAKRYGADAVYDYRTSASIGEIKKAYPNITKALDCFSEGTSAAFCADVFREEGGKVITLLDQGKPRKANVTYDFLMVYTAFGRKFQLLAPLGPVFPARPADREVIAKFYDNLSSLNLQSPPITTIKGGFDEIFEGLDTLRKGEGRGTKLVVEFQ